MLASATKITHCVLPNAQILSSQKIGLVHLIQLATPLPAPMSLLERGHITSRPSSHQCHMSQLSDMTNLSSPQSSKPGLQKRIPVEAVFVWGLSGGNTTM